MNVDCRTFFNRYRVAFYRRGAPTVMDLETGKVVDLRDTMPLDEAGFRALFGEWSGSPCPIDPDNFWIDDVTGERVPAA